MGMKVDCMGGLIVLLSGILVSGVVSASNGEKQLYYQKLRQNCISVNCSVDQNGDTVGWLSLLGWDCESNCEYLAIRQNHEDRIKRGLRSWKYFGKWPFLRVAGLQEPASSLFSIANLMAHLYCWRTFPKKVVDNRMRFWWQVYQITSLNTWFWSAAFHARDLNWTRILDYLFAGFSVCLFLFITMVRVFFTPVSGKPTRSNAIWVALLATLMLLSYFYHFWSMLMVNFDFHRNMVLLSFAWVLSNLLWLIWYLRYRRPYGIRAVVTITMVTILAAGFEWKDFFSPLGLDLIDAHALWHLMTVPMIFQFNKFCVADMTYSEPSLKDV